MMTDKILPEPVVIDGHLLRKIRDMRTYLMVAIVALVAIFVGFVVAAMFGAVDPLRADIAAALAPLEREKLDALNMVIGDDGPLAVPGLSSLRY